MDAIIKEWDGESVILRFDKATGAWIIISIHSTRLGPAIGGTRMKFYPDVASALMDSTRLARGMTYKWAASGIDGGGGKAVIAVPSFLYSQSRRDLLRRYGGYVKQLKGLFFTGPDLGTTAEDMDIIAEKADSYVFCKTPAAGGTGNPGILTAIGVFTSIEVTAERLFGNANLAGKKILVQGAGSVGRELIQLLSNANADILFSDTDDTAVSQIKEKFNGTFVAPDGVHETACDIYSPCAVGGILNEKTIPRLQCRAVVGAANNQLAVPDDAGRLEERNILYAPDFICNSGGIIGVISMESQGFSRPEAEDKVSSLIRNNLVQVFGIAEKESISTDRAAQKLAENRLAGAKKDG